MYIVVPRAQKKEKKEERKGQCYRCYKAGSCFRGDGAIGRAWDNCLQILSGGRIKDGGEDYLMLLQDSYQAVVHIGNPRHVKHDQKHD